MPRPPKVSDPWPTPRGLHLLTIARSVESPGSTYGPWLLDAFALTWVVEGGGRTGLDECTVETQPGSVLFMHPGQELRHDWGAQRSCQAFVVFDLEGLESPWLPPERWPLSRRLPPDHFLFVLWRYLMTFDLHEASSAALTVPILELMMRIYLSDAPGSIASMNSVLPDAVERATRAIAGHLRTRPAQALRLAGLAESCGVSEQHLCRLFREHLGMGPMECAAALRIELASGQLERTDESIGHIAERFGFSSQFYFSRVFKQNYGMSPSAYRRAHREGAASRPTGLMFRHHALRRYFYEDDEGKIDT